MPIGGAKSRRKAPNPKLRSRFAAEAWQSVPCVQRQRTDMQPMPPGFFPLGSSLDFAMLENFLWRKVGLGTMRGLANVAFAPVGPRFAEMP
jgi:hypothetical protein